MLLQLDKTPVILKGVQDCERSEQEFRLFNAGAAQGRRKCLVVEHSYSIDYKAVTPASRCNFFVSLKIIINSNLM